ncbi:MAG: methylmalonate-semialdehyde dehydrogenase (CoA acylating) [Dehalococcoidia bacterium]|nr:methylmalonate-semialdehyde dehydrogenase (CoA acylating) [Dehalococcoidia bacterium]
MATTQSASKAEALADGRALRNYVGGEWATPQTAEYLDVTNPATGELLGQVPLSSQADVEQAVAAAHAAFSGWRRTPPLDRARYLFAVREQMERRFEELARQVTLEHGKALEDARGSVRRAIENVEVASGIPSLLMGYGLEDGAASGIDEDVVRQPLGVFAAICPFNFPLMVPFWFWPYAVACGNTFIIKPSEQVPTSMQIIFEILDAAGFPPGVINLVNGAKATVDSLLDHPDVKGLSFVGSTPVARYLYARGAERGKRVQAQGGAKNVLVVMPDAVLDSSVSNIINSAFGSTGQRCLAGSVMVTVGDAHGQVRDAVARAAAALKVGNGLDSDVEVGPVISQTARERILGYIEQGEREGAALVLDGRQVEVEGSDQGFYVGPTIFDSVTPDMTIACDEIFGPVLSIMHVDTLDDAIEIIEQQRFGNAASIFTQDGAAAREFRYRVPTGNVGINVGVAAPMAYFPFSGAKESFFGTLHGQGRDAIDFFTDRKVVITRWF